MDYLLLKWIHIVSSTILFGTGIGSAFYMFMANRRKNLEGIYFATRHVVIADWIFTTPSVIIQFLTGIALAKVMGYELFEGWVFWALVLYFFAGLCWLPVVYMQIKMRDMAKKALKNKTELPALYWKMDFWWILLGAFAFPAIIIVFWLMVYKPEL
ncbi:MAG: DUF2269 family protein [Nitratireductor sp.]